MLLNESFENMHSDKHQKITSQTNKQIHTHS